MTRERRTRPCIRCALPTLTEDVCGTCRQTRYVGVIALTGGRWVLDPDGIRRWRETS